MNDPWYKATFQYSSLGVKLPAQVPHDVFSTQNIDEGTLLLLEHLPEKEPISVLDMGCGYGALGLPIAARFPNARVEMVDRDLLAVKWSEKNAKLNQLSNIQAHGSLGFRDLGSNSTYDWILCNMPARIGKPFIQNFVELGSSKLNSGGELRIVVIRDLGPILLEMKEEHQWPITEIAKGPRHTIFSISSATAKHPELSAEELYFRDQVQVQDLVLNRPFDFGGDDQKRLKSGLPVLIDSLPRQMVSTPDHRILCFRSGYGSLPLLCRKRWNQSKIVATERDLLGSTFLRWNADLLELNGDRLEIRENAHFPNALHANEKFNLILGELSSSAGEAVASSELIAIQAALAPRGQAVILCLEKIEKDWVRKFALENKIQVSRVLSREGFTVIRIEA